MERQYVKGRVYGETKNEIIQSLGGKFKIEPEPRFNRREIFESNIQQLIDEINTGVHPTSFISKGEIIKSFILEDGSGVKYEIVKNDNQAVTIEELDSDGIGTGIYRSYAIDVLAKLIYAHHFGFNVSNARQVIKYGAELHEYELAKYWC